MQHEQVSYEVCAVTPDQAALWLRSARKKVKTDKRLLDSYKRDMAANAWKLNGDPVIFDNDGALLDGRHRLMACIESGAPFKTLVVRGVNTEDFVTIDALRRRTASDVMHIRGEPHGRALAAALTFLWRAGLGDITKQSKKLSAPELVELLEKNSLVRRSITIAKDAAPLLPHGLGAALHYLFQNEDRGLADRFFEEMSAEASSQDSPTFALRRALENILEDGGRRSPVVTAALAIKAWTAFREGRSVKLIRYSVETEDFPDTPGLDGLELPDAVIETDVGSRRPTGQNATDNDQSQVRVSIEEISPAYAEDLLERNDKNRKIAKGIVEKYVRDMAAGNWALNGQTIKIGQSGRLLDGQHRLSACVKSNKPFFAIVVEGLDDEVFETFDVGNRRALTDILGDMGEINTALLAGAVRQLWQLENGLVQIRTATPSVNELLDTLERHPKIRESVNFGNNFRKLGAPSQLAALNYCFSKVDDRQAEFFIDRLVHGDQLTKGSPILLLRDALMEDRNNPKRKMGAPERIAITIKAWNAFYRGRIIKNLRWTSGREAFPAIDGLEFEGPQYADAA